MTNLYFFHLHACYSIFQNFFCAGIQFFIVLNSYLRTIIDDGYSEINHEYVYKNENHPYFKVLNRLSDVLRMFSSVSNDLSSLISKIYQNYLNEEKTDSQYKFLHNENECIHDIKNSISHISSMLDEFDIE